MVLFLIGLGLGDEKDITVRGLEAVKKSVRVYLEMYTAVLAVPKEQLEKFYECKVIEADREMVESRADEILRDADKADVSMLVVGDPLAATTHSDLLLRAAEKGIPYLVIHNASIMNAVAACGLQLYNFGQSVSIPFFNDNWRPDSFYAKIKQNRLANFHTMCLLDIKVKEQSEANMARGIKVYEPARFMSIRQAIEQLLEVEDKKQEGVINRSTIVIGMARVGQHDQRIISGSMEELLAVDFGAPLHTLIVPGPETHFIEEDMIEFYHWNRAARRAAKKAAEEAKDAEIREQQRKITEERKKAREEKERAAAAAKAAQQAAIMAAINTPAAAAASPATPATAPTTTPSS